MPQLPQRKCHNCHNGLDGQVKNYTGKMKAPSFKMIVTAVGGFAYRRPEDNVIVCPLAALKP